MTAADGQASRIRVLLVEDDDDIRTDLGALLEDAGFEVACAAHGGEALAALRAGSGRPSVILLDLMMPTMDGWAFRAAQLADAAIAAIPVLLVTAGSAQGLEPLKAAGCLQKPIQLDRLFAEVRRVASNG